jgi:hypothetical protein
VAVARTAETAISEDHATNIVEYARGLLREFVFDLCPPPVRLPPRKWPRPWPFPFAAGVPRALDLLVAGAGFAKAADVAPDGPLVEEFAQAADTLFQAGLQRLADQQEHLQTELAAAGD